MKTCRWAVACSAIAVLVLPAQGAPAAEISGPRELLELLGTDQSHFNMLSDGTPWQEGEDEVMLRIMYQLRHDFRPMEVEAWSRGDLDVAELIKDPSPCRGEIFRLAGRVVSVESRRPVSEMAGRFDVPVYYRCRMVLAHAGQPVAVFAHTIPEAWRAREPIDARAGASAMFLKIGGKDPSQPLPIFVTSRIAWYPPTRLGDLGMDVGLFDDLRPWTDGEGGSEDAPLAHRRLSDLRLTRRNRECFYQMLAAVGRSKPGALLTEAETELHQTGEDRFSVVPLFNEPRSQQGRLVVLSGTARQVIPIRVSDEDVVSRFGIDHYYQILLFTEDSRNNPLAFCVREIPEGMPTGEGAEFAEYVTVAGFFFNTWAYRNRRSRAASAGQPEWQLAPLLIGRDLVWRRPPRRAASPWLGAIAGGLFVLALLGIWAALWRYGRGDRQFRKTVIARQFAPPPAASPDRVGHHTPQTPDFGPLDETAGGGSDSSNADRS